MKIGLISVGTFVANGLRSISSFLRLNGHETIMVFFAKYELYIQMNYKIFEKLNIQQDLLKIFKDCDLIGVSCFTFNSYETRHIINLLRPLNIPIVWGGTHVNLCPEDALKYNDIICLGQGEHALLDFINRIEKNLDIYNTPNFWFKKNGKIIKNHLRPFIDINDLPAPDYSFKNHYLFDGFKFSKFDPTFHQYIHMYTIFGCPHNCTFCATRPLQKLFNNGSTKIHKKSTDKIINDLKEIRKTLSHVRYILFDDETFSVRTIKELKYFSKQYKKHINLPFTAYISPWTITPEKMEILIEAGMSCFEMGIQTGSEKINREIYRRNYDLDYIIDLVRGIYNKYKNKLNSPPFYDLLIDNPYEPPEETLKTFYLIRKLPTPCIICICSLFLYPKTELYKKAHKDGFIKGIEVTIDRLNNITHKMGIPDFSIRLKQETVNLFGILSLTNGISDFGYHGFLSVELIDEFLNLKTKYLELKVILPIELEQLIMRTQIWRGNFLPGMSKDCVFFLVKGIAFLRQHYHNIKDNTIVANFSDFEIVQKSITYIYNSLIKNYSSCSIQVC